MSISSSIVVYYGSANAVLEMTDAPATSKAGNRLFIVVLLWRVLTLRQMVCTIPKLCNGVPYGASGCGVLGRNLPQRLLEHLARLAARDQVLTVDDDGRHRMNPDFLPDALCLPHFIRERASVEDFERPIGR